MTDVARTRLAAALDEERLRLLDELHDSQQRYRALFDSAFAGIGITDADETFTLANGALEQLLGYGPGELVGTRLSEVTDDDEFSRYQELTRRRQEGERESYETTVVRRDGQERHVLISASPLVDGDGGFAGTMAVVVDVTEQRRVEARLAQEQERHTQQLQETVQQRTRELAQAQARLVQSEKMAAMGRLAAGVAHEINNPAGVLLMKLKFLLSIADDEGLSERARGTLGVAVEQTERIERIVENLLEFSRPSEGTPRPVALNDVAEAALRLGRPPGGATLRWEPAADLPAVEADPNELQQVVVNLVDNATDAAGDDGTVVVATERDGDEVTLRVTDDGAGIPEDFLDRIFDPFFTTKPVGEGTGLGLSVSYGIVEKFGGTITVDSRRHQGTTMTVRLPAVSP